jgi:hypothetical protein
LAFSKKILWLTVEFNVRACLNQSSNASFMILLYSTCFLFNFHYPIIIECATHYFSNLLCWKFHMNLSKKDFGRIISYKKKVTSDYTC